MAPTDSFYIVLIICLTHSKSRFSLWRINTITSIFAAQVSHGSHLVKGQIETEIINRLLMTSVSFNVRMVRGFCPLVRRHPVSEIVIFRLSKGRIVSAGLCCLLYFLPDPFSMHRLIVVYSGCELFFTFHG
jgi:hypothetical protein